jgi:2-polyprenyl-3-methyl-5-hydroxy-6-metoxy-1,4-benzoquinol methylase
MQASSPITTQIPPGTAAIEVPGLQGTLRLERLADGRHRISVVPKAGRATKGLRSWVTSYPVSLIREIHSAKDLWVCDEIMREEDPQYVERSLRQDVFAYVEPAAFAGKRVLDFGCGSGASSMVLSRVLPACEIVGVELEESLLRIARLRAEHFGRTSLRLLQSPSGETLPPGLGQFDYIIFSAVFEHLLPNERLTLLPKVWEALRPGGVLFLNDTPYRWLPVEIHTTQGMPLINYLPDSLTWWLVTRFNDRASREDSWETLLRRGIRGATVPEIVRILGGPKCATLLSPLPPHKDRIDLWYGTLTARRRGLKQAARGMLKAIKLVSGKQIAPVLTLAIRKPL